MAINLVSYIGNLGKSVAYATVDKVKDMAPATAEFMSTNNELYKSVYDSVRDYKTTYKRTNSFIKNSKIYEAGNVYFHALVEDISTGKLYNPERQNEMDLRALGGVNSSGMDDWGFNDDDFNLDSNDDFGSFTLGDEIVSESVKSSSKANANAVSMAIARTGEYVVENTKMQSNIAYAQNVQLFGQIGNSLNAVNENITKMLSFSDEVLKTHVDNSTKYYDTTTKLLQEQTNYLKQLTEALIPAKNDKQKRKKTTYEDLVGAEGTVDIKAYFDNVKNNVNNIMSSLPNMDISGEGGNTLLTFVAQPLKFLPLLMVNKLTPKMIEKSIKDFDKSLSGFFGSTMLKMNSMTKSDNIVKQYIGRIFGVNNGLKSDLDTSVYEKGKVAWDGKSKKALEEVIPTHLARIESLLSGKTERRFDYDKGKFISASTIKKDFENIKKNNSKNSSSDMMEQFEKYMDLLTFNSKSEKDKLDKDIRAIFDYMFNNGEIFDVNKKDFSDLQYKYGVDEKNLKIFRSLFRHAPRSMQMQINSSIMSNRQKQTQYLKSLEENGSIYSSLFNGLDINEFIKTNKDTKETKSLGLFGKNNLTETKDNKGHNIFYYLQNMNMELSYIRKAGGMGRPGDFAGSNQIITSDGQIVNIGHRFEDEVIPDDSPKSASRLAYESRLRQNNSYMRNERKRRQKNKNLLNVSELDDDVNIDGRLKSLMEDRDIQNDLIEKSNKKSSFIESLIDSESLLDKYKTFMDKSSTLLEKPAEFVAGIFRKVDQRMYEAIYGTGDGEEEQGFMKLMVDSTKKTFRRLNTWIDDNILIPMKEKLNIENFKDLGKKFLGIFGIEPESMIKDLKTYFFGNKETGESGLFSNIIDGFKDTFKSAFDTIKKSVTGTFKDITTPFRNRFKSRHAAIQQLADEENGDEYVTDDTSSYDYSTRDYIDQNIVGNRASYNTTAQEYADLLTERDFNNGKQWTSSHQQLMDLYRRKRKLQYDLSTTPDNNSNHKNLLKNKIASIDKKIERVKRFGNNKSNYQMNEASARNRINSIMADKNNTRQYNENRINDLFKLAGIDGSSYDMNLLLSGMSGDYQDYTIDDLIKSSNNLYGDKFSNIDYKKLADSLNKYKNNALITRGASTNINDILSNGYKDDIVNNRPDAKEIAKRFPNLINGVNSSVGSGSDIQIESRNYLKDIRDFLYSLKGTSKSKGKPITTTPNINLHPEEEGVLRSSSKDLADVIFNFLKGNTGHYDKGSNVLTEPKVATLRSGELVLNPEQVKAVSSLMDTLTSALGTAGNKLSDIASSSYKKFNRVKNLVGDKIDLTNFDDMQQFMSDDSKENGKRVNVDQYRKVTEALTNQFKMDTELDENGEPVNPIQKALYRDVKPFVTQMGEEFKTSVKSVRKSLFGTSPEDDSKKFQAMISDVSGNISEYAPKMLPAAVLGSGVSLISGAIGGPLLGAAVGAGTSLTLNSEKAQEWLFGEKIADERTGGVIPKGVIDTVQKYLPDASKYGIAGGLAGLFTPLGIVGGLTVGAGASFVKNNEQIQEMLFGEKGLFDDKQKEKIKKALPRVGLGALLGVTAGPFGLVGNAILGSAAGLATTSNRFNEVLLGKYNENTDQYENGILPALRESFVDPLRNFGDDIKTKFMYFLDNDIFKPIRTAIDPIKKDGAIVINKFVDVMGGAVDKVFEMSFGKPLSKLANDLTMKISGMAKSLGSAVLGMAKGVVSTPFKLLGKYGDMRRVSQIKHGYADYMTAEQRLAKMGDKNYKFRNVDEMIQAGDIDSITNLRDSLSGIMDLNKSDKTKRKELAQETGDEVVKYFSNTDSSRIMKAYRDGDYDKVNGIMRNSAADQKADIVNVMQNVLPYYNKELEKLNTEAKKKNWNEKDIEYKTIRIKDKIKSKFLRNFDSNTQKEILDRLDDESKFNKYMDTKSAVVDDNISKMKSYLQGQRNKFEDFQANRDNKNQVMENLQQALKKQGVSIDPYDKNQMDKLYNMLNSEINNYNTTHGSTEDNTEQIEESQLEQLKANSEAQEKRHKEIVQLFSETLNTLKRFTGEDERTNPNEDLTIGKTDSKGILTYIDNNGNPIQYKKELNGDLSPNLSDSGTRKAISEKDNNTNTQNNLLSSIQEKLTATPKEDDDGKKNKKGFLGRIMDLIGGGGGILKTAGLLAGGGILLSLLKNTGIANWVTDTVLPKVGEVMGDAVQAGIPVLLEGIGALIPSFASGIKSAIFPELGQGNPYREEADNSILSNGITRDVIKGGKGLEKIASKTKFKASDLLHPIKGTAKGITHGISKVGAYVGGKVGKLTGLFDNSKLGTKIKDSVLEKTSKFTNLFEKNISAKVGEEVVDNATSKFGQELYKGLTKMFDNSVVRKLLGGTADSIIENFIPKFVKEATEKAASGAAKVATRAGAASVSFGIATVGFAITDFVTGWNDTCNILKITPEQLDELGTFPRVISGLIKALLGAFIITSFIPEDWVVPTVVKLLSPIFGLDSDTITNMQQETQQTVDEYNKENNTNMDVAQYNHDVKGHTTMGEKLGFNVKDYVRGEGVLSSVANPLSWVRKGGDVLGWLGFDGAKSKIDNGLDWLGDKADSAVTGVKNWFGNLFSKNDTQEEGQGGPYDNTSLEDDTSYDGVGGPLNTFNKMKANNNTLSINNILSKMGKLFGNNIQQTDNSSILDILISNLRSYVIGIFNNQNVQYLVGPDNASSIISDFLPELLNFVKDNLSQKINRLSPKSISMMTSTLNVSTGISSFINGFNINTVNPTIGVKTTMGLSKALGVFISLSGINTEEFMSLVQKTIVPIFSKQDSDMVSLLNQADMQLQQNTQADNNSQQFANATGNNNSSSGSILSKVKNGVSNLYNSTKNFASGVWDKTVSTVKNVGTSIKNGATSLWNGFKNSMGFGGPYSGVGGRVPSPKDKDFKGFGLGGPYTGMGGEIQGIPTGTEPVSADVQKYADVFNNAGNQFGIDPKWIEAIAMQESGGNVNSDNGAALGIMQIEKGGTTDEFIKFGADKGESWTADDRRDPNKAIPFGASRLADLIQHYNGDYLKATQAYNFSKYSLDALLKAFPEDWMAHRSEVGQYNGTGLSSYGDPKYVEHVFRYYDGDGSFNGSASSSSTGNSQQQTSGGFMEDLGNLFNKTVHRFLGIPDESSSSNSSSGGSATYSNNSVDTSGLSGAVKTVVDAAASKIGCPYVWGGEGAPLTESTVNQYRGTDHDITRGENWKDWIGKEGYDCSGLMQYAFKQAGMEIGRSTYDQVKQGTRIDVSQAQAGDLVFFGSESAPHHVGLSIGNGQFIEAPSSGKTVKVSDISSRSDACCARRVIQNGQGGPLERIKNKRNITKAKYDVNKIINNGVGGPADTFFSRTLKGNVTSGFGHRDTRGSIGRNHTGIDIGAKQGQDIKSPIGGVVTKKVPSDKSNGYGNLVTVRDANGAEHYFGHMQNPTNLKPGDVVKPGDKLGYVGSTGNSTGSHLHYEVKNRGISVDPNKYLANKGIGGERDNKPSIGLGGDEVITLLRSLVTLMTKLVDNTDAISVIKDLLKLLVPDNDKSKAENSSAKQQKDSFDTQKKITDLLMNTNRNKNKIGDQQLLQILTTISQS